MSALWRCPRRLVPVGVVLLAACAAPPPAPAPAPKPLPPDRVVLLPDADGKVGAVLVRSNSGVENTVNQAYQAAEVGRDGAMVIKPEDPAAVQARYRTLLEARPAQPQTFVLYFQSGGNELLAESQAQLAQIRAALARRPAPEIQVIGHTDRVGGVDANDQLSRQRAGAVKGLLVRFGIAAEQIATSGRGEREPLVPTADEVAEPRNRRVEVTVR